MSDFIISAKLNKDGLILDVSNMLCSISKYKKDEIIGKEYHSLLSNADDKRVVFKYLS